MAYTALYRKWRPQGFSEVRGQDHVVKTLKNQLLSNRVGHAYLFTGTRGTGKTTVAKIFARAVNCEHPKEDGSPCNECAVCKAVLSGSSVNVVEIDAASNNGVDNIREIREEVKYRPTEGRYRVYIIDEVHMLSAGAFNALLKTLEEPPEYVIFILATTEVHRIPITVLSRCQRYDFRRLSFAELSAQIRDIFRAESVDAEEEAISYIARRADGSSRDALSLMEQCVSLYYGEKLSYERVLSTLGAADQSAFSGLLRKILQYDVNGAVALVDDLLSQGRELSQFVTDFTWYLRNIMLVQTDNPGEEVLGISRENLELMQEEAKDMDLQQVMRYIRILGECSNQMRFAANRRVIFELALLQMMQPALDTDLSSVMDRLRILEDRLGLSENTPVQRPAERGGDAFREPQGFPSAPVKSEQLPPKEISASEADFSDYNLLRDEWDRLISEQRGLLRSYLQGTKISVSEEGGLSVLFRNEFNYTSAQRTGKEKELSDVLQERYGKTFRIAFRCLQKNEPVPRVVLGRRIPGINMDIEMPEEED